MTSERLPAMLLLRMTATIGLIAAMGMEARPVLRLLGPGEPYPLQGFRARRFASSGADCILVESGMGAKRAEAASRALLSAVEPRLLVSFGIAGAVERDVHVGDVIIASQASFLEDGRPGRMMACASLPETAWRAVERALAARGARLYAGTAITTSGEQPTLSRLGGAAHPMVEMETAGIARAAMEHGTPLLSIRSMSDTPDEPIPISVDGFLDTEHNPRPARIAWTCLRHPSIIPGLLRFSRNGRKAAGIAAIVVAAILIDPFLL